ncbi:MAG: ATP-binding protein [Gemmataceae bacterium]
MPADPAWSRLRAALRRWWRRLVGADLPPPFLRQFREFFGDDFDRLETHDKAFPGYDIVSVVRALRGFADEGRPFRDVGACLPCSTVRQMLDFIRSISGFRHRPDKSVYQRVPVDVEQEESVISNGVFFLEVGPDTGSRRVRRSARLRDDDEAEAVPSGPEKLAVFVVLGPAPDYWPGMEANMMTSQSLQVGVACRSRDAADRFFAELDDRRRRLSIYRGKVISPVIHGGHVLSLGFRAIKRVTLDDLVLPEAVRSLLDSAIIGFYQHKDVLTALGIELKRGILLHGPPGTGKTSISLYLAGLLPDFTVCFVSGEQLLHPRAVCQMARYLQPSMVVFEDIDLIAADRDANGLATVLGELMNQIDGCDPTDQVLFVMNTNSLARLESAVRNRPGRVDQIIEVPLPDREARQRLLATFARGVRLPGGEMDRALTALRDMSPAMIKEVVKRSVVAAIHRDGSGGRPQLREDDLITSAEQVQALREPIAPGQLGFRRSHDGDEEPWERP